MSGAACVYAKAHAFGRVFKIKNASLYSINKTNIILEKTISSHYFREISPTLAILSIRVLENHVFHGTIID
jgi:hypothetical protein